jgi:hypothetical protein
MKKLGIVAIALSVTATVAYASSLAVPWFEDNAAPGNDPGNINGIVGIVYLKSNAPAQTVCTIEYFNEAGDSLGPQAPFNTFTIESQSSLYFRPARIDPNPDVTAGDNVFVRDNVTGQQVQVIGVAGGQEGFQGVRVPDRPRSADASTPIVGHPDGLIDVRSNGSITISWVGGDADIQGAYSRLRTKTLTNGSVIQQSYGHLLPPGVN